MGKLAKLIKTYASTRARSDRGQPEVVGMATFITELLKILVT